MEPMLVGLLGVDFMVAAGISDARGSTQWMTIVFIGIAKLKP